MTKNIFTRLYALALLLIVCAINAMADNKVYVGDVRVGIGETVTVPVCLDNTDSIVGLQLDLVLPEGLSYVEESVSQNTARALKRNYGVSAVPQANGNLRILLASTNLVPIPAGDGWIVTIDLKADAKLKVSSPISVTNVVASDKTGVKKAQIAAGEQANVTNTDLAMTVVPAISCDENSEITIKPGEEFTVDFILNNDKTLYGMQGEIVIPEGFEIVPGLEGDFIYTDRLPVQYSIASNDVEGAKRFVISSLDKDAAGLQGTSGVLFSIKLRATSKAATLNEFVLRNIVVVGNLNISQKVEDSVSLSVKVLGDPTRDGEWNVMDVDAVIDAILNGTDDKNCDVNNDGSVDVMDLDEVYEKIL